MASQQAENEYNQDYQDQIKAILNMSLLGYEQAIELLLVLGALSLHGQRVMQISMYLMANENIDTQEVLDTLTTMRKRLKEESQETEPTPKEAWDNLMSIIFEPILIRILKLSTFIVRKMTKLLRLLRSVGAS